MARKYAVGDKVILTRAISVKHFQAGGLSIVGEIVEIVEDGHQERSAFGKAPRNYGIKFSDRPWVDWYANWEFRRVRQ
jgi:hypothetical protein